MACPGQVGLVGSDRVLPDPGGDGWVGDGGEGGRPGRRAAGEAAADGGHDLVVIGNAGMTGPRRLTTLGSVPNKVSHSLGCSLLIVRTT